MTAEADRTGYAEKLLTMVGTLAPPPAAALSADPAAAAAAAWRPAAAAEVRALGLTDLRASVASFAADKAVIDAGLAELHCKWFDWTHEELRTGLGADAVNAFVASRLERYAQQLEKQQR